MFKRDEAGGVVSGETVIAQGVKVEGDFKSTGNVVIEGEVAGSVIINGDLRVGESAKIQANVTARNATIAGEVQGNLTVSERLDLAATSKITGDIVVSTMEVAAGALMNGKITMGNAKKGSAE